jgi:hypothetical protein
MALLYRISSKDKSSGSTCDFVFDADQTVNARKITVSQVQFPNLFPNVREGINDTISWTGGTVTIPEGFYSISELTVYLTANMADLTWDVDTAGVITITNAGAEVTILAASLAGFFNMIGAPVSTDYTVAVGLNTLPYFPNLLSHTQLYLLSRSLSSGHNLLTHDRLRMPVIATIPLTVAYGEVQTYRPTIEDIDSVVFENRHQIGETDIKLVDCEFRQVYLDPNHTLDVLLHVVPT